MHRAIPPLVMLALLVATSHAQQSATLPSGYLVASGNSSTSYPFSNASDHKWQWHYDASQLATSGPVVITEIWVRASAPTANLSAFSFPNLTVTLASSPTDYSVSGSLGQPPHDPVFANNLNLDATVVRSGPFIGGPVTASGGVSATWIPLGLTPTFIYDPTTSQDFVMQIEKCGTTTQWDTSLDGISGAAGVVLGNRYGEIASCAATASTFQNNEFVPVIRLDYIERNRLTMAQSAPMVGDLSIGLDMISQTAAGGFTLVSTHTSLPVGSGPVLGLVPSLETYQVFGFPYFPGNPFHFSTGDLNLFPHVVLDMPPGTVTHLTGLQLDFACFLYGGSGAFDSQSNVVRVLFQ